MRPANASYVTNETGMTLIELVIVAGLMSVMAIGSGYAITKNYSDLSRSQSTAGLSQTQMMMSRWLLADGATNPNQPTAATCAQTIKIVSSGASAGMNTTPGHRTNVEIHDPSSPTKIYSASSGQQTLPGGFTISQLYLGDAQQIRTEGSGADQQNVVLATLWLEGKGQDQQAVIRRAVTALTLKVNTAGQITDCNAKADETAENNCTDLSGAYVWSSGVCQSLVQTDGSGNFSCQSGLVATTDGRCAPPGRACASGSIPQGFDGANFVACSPYN